MTLLLAAVAVLLVLAGIGRVVSVGMKAVPVLAGIAAAGLAVGAILRGEPFLALGLVVAAAWLGTLGRRSRPAAPVMDAGEARAILGVGAEAGREEIEAAYRRLMRRAHPDAGGSAGLARQLNAARERLLGKG